MSLGDRTSASGAPPDACPAAGGLPAAVYEKSLDCVHCGLCLSACPTYVETGRETSSPRGRIYLMRGVAEGRVPVGALLAEEAFLCLGCRACETACPSGVEYGAMVELARESVVAQGLRNGLAARLERALLRHVVAHPRRLRAALGALRLAQTLRLDRLATPLLPSGLRAAQALAPRVPPARERAPLPAFTPAHGERRGRVAFFRGCIMSELFAQTHRRAVRVLAHNGFDVAVPPAQRCCGALQAHAGDGAAARALARHNAAVFADAAAPDALGAPPGAAASGGAAAAAPAFDALVVDAAGCGAALREAPNWIGAEGEALAARTRDICEWLDEAGLRPPTHGLRGRVCYDDPCHLVHAQRIFAAPRRLLQSIPGLELVEHADASACCGAAGVYNLTHPDMSRAVLARKMDALEQADPDWIATGNPGCAMQLAAGVRERGLRARVVHPVELLDRAYGGADAGAHGPPGTG